jgi:hypothetical protein
MKRKGISFSISAAVIAMLLSSCGPRAAATPDPAVLARTVSVRVTELVIQTQIAACAAASATTPPTISATVIPPAISSATPTRQSVDFTGNEIFTAFLENGQSQVSILVPNGIQGDYSAKIDGKEFSCFTYKMKGVDRLICLGPSLPRGNVVELIVFSKGGTASIFSRQFSVPN